MKRYLAVFVLALLAVTGSVFVLAQEDDTDLEAKIELAMSAAPLNIAQDATILERAFDEDGKFVVLREGTNGWSCLTPRPMCLDEVFMEWIYALIAKDDLIVTKPGFTYMFQGGATNSNADPYATEAADDQWVSSSPYMMVIFPSTVSLSGFSTDPNDPLFVMYPDTPYQHLMVPVGDMAGMEP